MVRMTLEQWEERHGIEQQSGTRLITGVSCEDEEMTSDFLNQSDVEGQDVGRRKRRSMEAETVLETTGRHQSTRATDLIDESVRETADKYIPRTVEKPSRKKALSRSSWASKISKSWLEAHDAAVNGIFQVGEQLIAAQEALTEEEWEHMLSNELPFGLRTVQRLMAVARDKRLRTTAQLLPASWGTLYELTKLSDSELDKLASDGVLRPEMERREVSAARKELRLGTIGEPARATRGEHLRDEREEREEQEEERAPRVARVIEHDVEPFKPDARKTLQEIVSLIELSEAPAAETLAAVLTLAKGAL